MECDYRIRGLIFILGFHIVPLLAMPRSDTRNRMLTRAAATERYNALVSESVRKCFKAIGDNNPENLQNVIHGINPENMYPSQNKNLFHAQRNFTCELRKQPIAYIDDSFTRSDQILSILLSKADNPQVKHDLTNQ